MDVPEQFAESQTRARLAKAPSPGDLAVLAVEIGRGADGRMRAVQLLGPAVACKKGCSHCCHQFVTALIPEVLRLADEVRASYSEERLDALRERMSVYLAAVEGIPRELRIPTVRLACPLLESDLCGAFEARPLACRRHNSLEVQACIERRQGARQSPAVANAEQTKIGDGLLTGWAIGLRRSRLQEALVELIPALDIALRIPDAAERYLRGEPVFDETIVAGYDPEPIRRAIKARRSLGIPID